MNGRTAKKLRKKVGGYAETKKKQYMRNNHSGQIINGNMPSVRYNYLKKSNTRSWENPIIA